MVDVPILGGDRVLGTIVLENYERENAFGEAEVRLLSTVAASMGVALENARLFDETQRLLKETEQRAAELAVINSIQEGMAAELDFQAIVDLVGDKLREVLHTGDIGIRWYDAKTDLIHYLYEYEHGERLTIASARAQPGGMLVQMLQTRAAAGHEQRSPRRRRSAASRSPAPTPSKSMRLRARSWAATACSASIILENYERENAFGESEVRLLTHRRRQHGRRAGERAPVRRDAAAAEGNRAARAELAVINSIQEGMAAELDFQAIVDLVGDKLREVFDTGDIGIRWYDRRPALVHYPLHIRARQAAARSPARIADAGRRLAQMCCAPGSRWSSTNRAPRTQRTSAAPIPGHRRRASRRVFVPILGGDRVLRRDRPVENYERENAFGEAEVRLLSTVAASMGVALENARLFDETQRLLKETEQRNAELAVINSIQEAMAAELDFQAIIDLVGDKLREVFNTGDIGIRWLRSRRPNSIHYLYSLRARQAADHRRRRARRSGRSFARMLRTRRAAGHQQDLAEISGEGFVQFIRDTDTGTIRRSIVPILGGDRVLGAIILGDYERENAFGESEVRLLQTVAASMGVALENARLFDETQRLFKESEQRAAELAIINSVQQALAAELNMQGIYDAVGDKIREIFHQADMGIRIYDPQTGPDPLPVRLRGGQADRHRLQSAWRRRDSAAHVLRTRETLVINENMAEAVEKYGSFDAARHADGEIGGLSCRWWPATRRAG